MSRAVITRVSENDLQEEAWTFSLVSDYAGCRVVLERYVKLSRESKRHRWRTIDRYDVFSNKGRTLNRPAPPADVTSEALDILIQSVSAAMDQFLRKCCEGADRSESDGSTAGRAAAA